jgi:predicted RNase H-like HicB family nuclease
MFMKKEYSFTVAIEPCKEGGYFATCPSIPGCHVQGETYEETLCEMKSAIKAMIEDYLEDRKKIPSGDVSVTTVKVAV